MTLEKLGVESGGKVSEVAPRRRFLQLANVESPLYSLGVSS